MYFSGKFLIVLFKLLSYFYPITIFRRKSARSESLEVTWNNGELVLDSKNTNYSYGSLQRILRKGLKAIGFEHLTQMEHVLVLGVAGGSVVRTLTDEIGYRGKITGIEIDPEVAQIAREFFHLDQIENFELLIDDAFEFTLKTKEQYDLIIIDVFEDTEMPNFLFERFFTKRIGAITKAGGFVLFNTMLLSQEAHLRNQAYASLWPDHAFEVKTLPRVEQHNELFLIRKKPV